MYSYINKNKHKLALVDGRASEKVLASLEKLELNIVKTSRCLDLYPSIAYHPDMLMTLIDEETLVIAPNVFDYYANILESYEINLLKGKSFLKNYYPATAAYNVARIGNHAVHNKKYTDPVVVDELKKRGVELIDIKQAYSKCTMLPVNGNSCITCDRPMAKKLEGEGYEVLLLDNGYIDLIGQEYGFIGGAGGNYGLDTILFTGSLARHPQEKEILKFLEDRKIKPSFLSDDKIVDLGTVIIM